jgi:hypothetical protein
MGNVHLSPEQAQDPAVLEREAFEYAQRFLGDEKSGDWYLGYTNYSTNQVSMFAIEAVRLLAGGTMFDARALQLLEMAVKELRQVIRKDSKNPLRALGS